VTGTLGLLFSSGPAWATANWAVHVATVNKGEAQAQALPAAPTATSTCTSPASAKTVKVSWTAVAHATTYAVYQSNTTASGTYTLQTSGVTTTSWTTAALTTGDYWYEVVTDVGSNWASAKSAASAERIISSSSCS
jgi:fibronectin type 3 domain-containing protein